METRFLDGKSARPLPATVEVEGKTVRILAVHAQAPMNGETYRLHRAQYELLEREAAHARELEQRLTTLREEHAEQALPRARAHARTTRPYARASRRTRAPARAQPRAQQQSSRAREAGGRRCRSRTCST